MNIDILFRRKGIKALLKYISLCFLLPLVAAPAAHTAGQNSKSALPGIVSLLLHDGISRVLTGALNDTGISIAVKTDWKLNATCTSDITSPQDCHYGRDATHPSNADGAVGFSFTKIDKNGNALPANAKNWACVLDNVTGLIWEMKTADGGIHDKKHTYRWGGNTRLGSGFGNYYPDWSILVDASNQEQLCGFNDWRVPTRRELADLSFLLDLYGRPDSDYFPNIGNNYFWTASPYAKDSQYAWAIGYAPHYPNLYLERPSIPYQAVRKEKLDVILVR